MFKKAQTPSAKGVRDPQMQKCRGFALRGSQSEESKGQSLNLSTFSDFPSQSLVAGKLYFPRLTTINKDRRGAKKERSKQIPAVKVRRGRTPGERAKCRYQPGGAKN